MSADVSMLMRLAAAELAVVANDKLLRARRAEIGGLPITAESMRERAAGINELVEQLRAAAGAGVAA